MYTPFKTALKSALIPALALAVIVPAAASAGNSDDIVVTSVEQMKQWKKDATRTLNRALAHSPVERRAQPASGIVQVSFSLDSKGKPTGLELESSSANWAAERSAMFAVRSLGDIGDVPVSNPGGARFLANIVFADSAEEGAQLAAILEQSERTRLASGTERSEFIALGG